MSRNGHLHKGRNDKKIIRKERKRWRIRKEEEEGEGEEE